MIVWLVILIARFAQHLNLYFYHLHVDQKKIKFNNSCMDTVCYCYLGLSNVVSSTWTWYQTPLDGSKNQFIEQRVRQQLQKWLYYCLELMHEILHFASEKLSQKCKWNDWVASFLGCNFSFFSLLSFLYRAFCMQCLCNWFHHMLPLK